MYYDYGAHVKGEPFSDDENSQSVNLLIFISNTLIELFNDFGFECDGIPKRPTMYLIFWSYKAVRYRYSNPMIQPEPEGSTQGYPLVSVEVLRFDTSAGNPVNEILLKLSLPDHRIFKDGGEGQPVQIMIMRNRNCKMIFAKPQYLKKAQSVIPRLYDTGFYNDNLALMLSPESDEIIRLAQQSR
ncbi:hypothetical protein Tco_0815195 [Tanacetum coccineum]